MFQLVHNSGETLLHVHANKSLNLKFMKDVDAPFLGWVCNERWASERISEANLWQATTHHMVISLVGTVLNVPRLPGMYFTDPVSKIRKNNWEKVMPVEDYAAGHKL